VPTSAQSRARRDRAIVIAGSAVGHLVVLVLIGLNAPQVQRVFIEDDPVRDPPPVVIDLYRPPPPPRQVKRTSVASPLPSPVRPRPVAPQAPPPAIAPLPMAPVAKPVPAPPATPPPTGAGSGGAAIWPDRPEGELREALRRSVVGCANQDAVGLTRRERENCDEKLGKGAKDAPFIPAPMAAAKRERFDAAAARKDVARRRKEGAVPSGVSRDNAGGTRTDGIGMLDY